jgi:diguanylate cyclase (GGDEF)-like protein
MFDTVALISWLNVSILLGGSCSFFIVSARYPVAIRRALIFHASAGLNVAGGAVIELLFRSAAPQLSQAIDVSVAGTGTGLYYLAYRSLQERDLRLRMVVAFYALFLLAVVYAFAVAGNANLSIAAVALFDVVLFGLAGRDVLLNFAGHGRAHLIQGIGLVLFALLIGIWGGSFLLVPPAPVVIYQPDSGLMLGLLGNCFAAAFGATNFLLMCNDEFNARLLTLVATDPLTGVANRRKLMERGEEELSRARRYNFPLSVVMVDLDHFKRLNDTHGHALGDQALRAAAQLLVAGVREVDLVSRSGGEEFAILLPGTDLPTGIEIAERLRLAVRGGEIPSPHGAVGLTASFGVAELQPRDVSIDQVIARADRALYRAKAEGRDRVSHDSAALDAPLPDASPA